MHPGNREVADHTIAVARPPQRQLRGASGERQAEDAGIAPRSRDLACQARGRFDTDDERACHPRRLSEIDDEPVELASCPRRESQVQASRERVLRDSFLDTRVTQPAYDALLVRQRRPAAHRESRPTLLTNGMLPWPFPEIHKLLPLQAHVYVQSPSGSGAVEVHRTPFAGPLAGTTAAELDEHVCSWIATTLTTTSQEHPTTSGTPHGLCGFLSWGLFNAS